MLPISGIAQTQQSFGGLTGDTPYTLGAATGSAPAAPTLGYLEVVNPATPTNQRPYVVFDSSPDLSGAQANGSVVIEFDYRIPSAGVADGFGVALLNTAVHGTQGALDPASNVLTTGFNWEQPKPTSSFAVGFDIYGAAPDNKNQINLNWNGVRVATVQTDASSFSRYEIKNGQWARVRIEIRKSGADSLVTVKFTSSADTANPTTYTPFKDQLISGMNLPASRLAFGARTGGSSMLLHLDNVRTRRLNESVAAAQRVYPLDDDAPTPTLLSAQTFSSGGGGLAYTLGAGSGLVPLAPTAGFLSLLRVEGTTNPTGSKPNVVFAAVPQLSGPAATGSVKLQFDYRMHGGSSGSQADGFGLAFLATDASGNLAPTAANLPKWERPAPAGSFGVGFDIYQSSTSDPEKRNQVSLNWAGAQVSSGTQGLTSFNLKNNLWNRVILDIRRVGADSRVTLQIVSDVNGASPVVNTVYDDFLVTGMNLPASRLAFGARTGGLWTLCDLDNVQVSAGELHVDPVVGADTASGTPLKPLRTIQAAVNKAGAGDIVVLADGTHTLSKGNGTPATVFLNKPLHFVGQASTGTGKTTVTGDWVDVVDDQFDLGNPLFAVNPHAEGSSFQGIEFRGGPGRPVGVTAWDDSHRPIGAGVRLNAVRDVSILDSVFINFHGPALYLWENRRLEVRGTDFTDSGYGNTVLAPGAAGAEAGAVKFVALYDSVFDTVKFLNTTSALGTGYGIKVTGAIVNNVFNNITCDLKGASSWQQSAGAGAAPTFFIEATAQKHNISQGFKASDVVGNVISNCNIRNPLSLQMGGNGMNPLPVGTLSFHLHHNVIQTRGEYVIEGGTDNMLLEYNHSKTLSFYNNSGASGANITIRFNIVENVDDYFVRLTGDSSGLKVYHNTVTSFNRSINNTVRTPVFLRMQGDEIKTAALSKSRDFRNNVFVGPADGGPMHFIRFLALPEGNLVNTLVTKNHVYLGTISAVYNSTGGIVNVPAGIITLTGNTGGTAAANNPLFTGGTGDVWSFYRPQSGSPLRNIGANLGLPGTDSTPDIGAVQY